MVQGLGCVFDGSWLTVWGLRGRVWTQKAGRRGGVEPPSHGFHMQTLIIYKLGSMKFSTHNDLY